MGPESEYVQIPLTRGEFASVDWDTPPEITKVKWCFSAKYAYRRTGGRKKGRTVYMHRLLTGTRDGYGTDHANGSRLDNRSRNLRECTKSQNAANTLKVRNSSSRFKGVWWDSDNRKWAARVAKKHLGRFTDELEAARAYDEAARNIFGAFARVNGVS